jgi:sialate O-acetylesterase
MSATRSHLLPFALTLLAGAASAEVRLPALFADHMVLQRDTAVAVWGWADPGEQVTVTGSWSDAAQQATAGEDGRWRVTLPTGPAGGPHTLAVEGANRIELGDVLLGEVWVCSGQSNMEWSIDACRPLYTDVKAGADHPELRLFDVGRAFATSPQQDCEGRWAACTPETLGSFSAVAFFYGRELHRELGVPVGLISSNWGGTLCEAWTSEETIARMPDFAVQLDVVRAERGLAPDSDIERKVHHNFPTALYNGMLAPLIPYGIRGAIWYQGESNRGRAAQYHELFPAMIRDWRAKWGIGDFPFYFVQIAPFHYGGDQDHQPAWLREAQRLALRVPNTGMAVTMDIGNELDIHPKNKHEVGRRLALWALARTYGRPVPVWSGPLYSHHTVENGALRLHFEHAGAGLWAPGRLTHFEIRGEDGAWKPAAAKLEGATVVVSSPEVPAPVAARYGFANAAETRLRNSAGLPASSFTTETWP